MSPVVQVAIDEQNPWPGLGSFDEGAERFFNGRGNETAELRRLVLNAPLTVLFGASGLGKTSLVQAGLFPLLRKQHYLPVYVRLDLSDRAAPLIEQIKLALHGQLEARHVDAPPIHDDESLWSYLHRERLELWSEQNQLLTPLFVFDQFEEVFTLGAENAEAIAALRIDLADLIENRLPTPLARSTSLNGGSGTGLSLDSQRYKVVLSFREDFLPAVESWKRELPSILRNRLRLLPMTGEQAFEAIHTTGSALVDESLARDIVSFVAAAQDEGAGVAAATPDSLRDLAVEPALLSLLCSGLNEKRKGQNKARFDEALLRGTGQSIISEYYAKSVGDLPERVQRFIENELITERGFRKPCDIDDARSVHGVTDRELRLLVDRRVLRIEPQRGTERVELTHDLLTRVVREHREQQRERERARRQRRRISVFSVIGMVLAGLVVVFAWLYLRANRAQYGLTKQQAATQRALEAAKDQRSEAEKQAGNARLAANSANDARLYAEQQRNVADTAAQQARVETIMRRISQATTEFQVSPTRGLLLGVEALSASRREQLTCGPQVTCVDEAAKAVISMLSETGGIPLIGHKEQVLALSFSADGKTLATADKKGANLWRVDHPETPFASLVLTGPTAEIQSVSLSPDGSILATSAFGIVQLFRTNNLRNAILTTQPFSFENMGPTSASFSQDGRLMLAATGVQSASVWRLDHLDKPIIDIGPPHAVRFASFTTKGELLTLDLDGKLWEWRADQLEGKHEAEPVLLGDLQGVITAAFFSADGKFLLIPRSVNTAGVEKVARYIDLFNDSAKWKDEPPTPGGAFAVVTQTAALSAQGELAAIADEVGNVQLWRVREKTLFAVLRGHEGTVYAVSFNPDGRHIATGGKDGTVRLWQIDHPSAIPAENRSVEYWSAHLKDLTELAGKTAGRNLTRKEWSTFFPGESYHPTFPEFAAPDVQGKQ